MKLILKNSLEILECNLLIANSVDYLVFLFNFVELITFRSKNFQDVILGSFEPRGADWSDQFHFRKWASRMRAIRFLVSAPRFPFRSQCPEEKGARHLISIRSEFSSRLSPSPPAGPDKTRFIINSRVAPPFWMSNVGRCIDCCEIVSSFQG